jgi:hypothetical protein
MATNISRDELEKLAVQYTVCPRCEAKPGVECVSVEGAEAREVHSSRLKPLKLAYTLGISYAHQMTETAR